MATEATTRTAGFAAGAMVSPEEYERIALDFRSVRWELHRGWLREKPAMTVAHYRTQTRLGFQLMRQLDEHAFEVRIDAGRVRRPEDTYDIPDVFVVPAEFTAAIPDRPDVLEIYAQPLPLVAEVWSPSTGAYDVNDKLRAYQRRGDCEIWPLHPDDRTLTAWRRQPDGTDAAVVFTGGAVQPVALPGVTIDLEAIFRSPG